jgi:hypothetical protein
MKEERWLKQLRRFGTGGFYIVKAAESPPARVEPRTPPPSCKPLGLSSAQRGAARSLLALKRPLREAP